MLTLIYFVMMSLWIVVVFILLTLSYAKARKCLKGKSMSHAQNEESSDQIESQTNRERKLVAMKILRLTLIFLIMYIVFLLAVVPQFIIIVIQFISGEGSIIADAVVSLMLTTTSTVNPILTLSLKEDFNTILADRARRVKCNKSTHCIEPTCVFTVGGHLGHT